MPGLRRGSFTYKQELGWRPGANTIAYYPLNSNTTVNDMSGNNHTLTTTGTATYDSLGVQLGSGANYLVNGDTAMINFANPYTISCWVKITSKPNLGVSRSASNQSFTGWNFSYGEVSGNFRLEFITTGGTNTNTYTFSNDNKWHLWTMTISGTSALGYIDGEQRMTTTTNNSYPSATIEFSINRLNGETNRGGGYYSECIIENKARSQEEITKYYNQTKSKYLNS